MSSARINRDEGHFLRPLDKGHVPSSARKAKLDNSAPETIQPNRQMLQRRVLRILVEEFGGEATGSALARCLSGRSDRMTPTVGSGLTEVLQVLERMGAIDLETDETSDIVVRILPHGAEACSRAPQDTSPLDFGHGRIRGIGVIRAQ